MSDHEHHPGRPGAHGHGGGEPAGHSHGVSADADRRWLAVALTLISAFMVAEVIVGVAASSLALISDAAHMLTDAASIVLAMVAMRLSARPARGTFTYGLKRAEILSAQANGLTLLLLGTWLAYEAVRRLISPPEVEGGLMLAVALTGIVVNTVATWCISKANRSSLNVEGAYQHIFNDLFAFIGTAIAALIVVLTGFDRADAIATLVVVALMAKAGYGLVRDSGRIFLEAAPAGADPDAIGDELASQPSVVEVHDLHVWTITSGEPALSAHVLVEPDGDCHAVRRHLQQLLRETRGISHATLQVDHLSEDRDGADDLLQIAPPEDTGPADQCDDTHGRVHRPDRRRH